MTDEKNMLAVQSQSKELDKPAGRILPDIPASRLSRTISELEGQLKSYDLALAIAKQFEKANLVPDSFREKETRKINVEAVAIAIIAGLEVDLSPIQSVQSFYVINGIPTMYGMAPAAIIEKSGVMEWIKDEWIKELPGGGGYRVTTKRKGKPDPYVTEFTMAEAAKGKLLEKVGPWRWDEPEMCMYRARGRQWKRYYADVMKGLRQGEEEAWIQASLEDRETIDAKQGSLQDHLAKQVTHSPQQTTPAEATQQIPEQPPKLKTRRVQGGILDILLFSDGPAGRPEWNGFILTLPSGLGMTFKVHPQVSLQPAELGPQGFVCKNVLVTYSEEPDFLAWAIALADPDEGKAPKEKKTKDKKKDPETLEGKATPATTAGTPPTKASVEIDAKILSELLDMQNDLVTSQMGQALFAGIKKDFGLTSREPIDDLKADQIEPYRQALKVAVNRSHGK